MSSKRILRKIKTEFDFQSYIEENYACKYSPNGELRMNCIGPNCLDSKFKLYVNNDKKYFNCFKCDFRTGNYDVFDFYAITEGITRGQAMLRLGREFVDVTPENLAANILDELNPPRPSFKPAELHYIDSLPEGCHPLTGPTEPLSKPFWQYLTDVRGLTPEEIKAINIHYVPSINKPVYDSNNKYRGNIGRRIVFPVYGGSHKLVSWLSRSLGSASSGPKYFNCPESDLAKTLWPFVKPYGNQAILVEGVLDATAVRRLSKHSSYATFGKSISPDQIRLLKDWNVNEIVLLWDEDAKREITLAIEKLKMQFDDVRVVDTSCWPQGWDAGNFLKGSQDKLSESMVDTIDVYSLDFTKWAVH